MKIQFRIRVLNASTNLRGRLGQQLHRKGHRRHPLTGSRWSGAVAVVRA